MVFKPTSQSGIVSLAIVISAMGLIENGLCCTPGPCTTVSTTIGSYSSRSSTNSISTPIITSAPSTTTTSSSLVWGTNCPTFDCWCTVPPNTIRTFSQDRWGCWPCGCWTASVTHPWTTPSISSSSPVPTGQILWHQCGGIAWTGPTTCAEGRCHAWNDWYSE